MNIKYPTRCRIINADGLDFYGHSCRNPQSSYHHIGKTGIADRVDGEVLITLEDGTHIWGHECWWEPIDD